MKITKLSMLSIASLTLFFSACGSSASTTANPSTAANTANQTNTAAVVNSSQTPVNNAGSVANTASDAAQSKAGKLDPDAIVKNLYAEHKSGSGPFFQTKERARVDKYFRKDLADKIWKDAVDSNGEVGAIDFDPLYGSQDPQIKDFVIMETGWGGDKKFGGEDDAVVQVTFKDSGVERMISYQFERGKDKTWKIFDVHYREDGDEIRLADLLTGAQKK